MDIIILPLQYHLSSSHMTHKIMFPSKEAFVQGCYQELRLQVCYILKYPKILYVAD